MSKMMLVALCREVYAQWTEALLVPFDPTNPPRLVSVDFYNRLVYNIDPEVLIGICLSGSIGMVAVIDSGKSVSERNSLREDLIRQVTGRDPLARFEEEQIRRRIRSAMIDLIVSQQKVGARERISSFEGNFAPRAWDWIKDCDLRGLYDVSHITHLDTEKGGKITSVSPRELAYAAELLEG